MERTRNPIRAVAMPSEHGGWGLTIEPGLLGLLVAPSLAGACLAAAALVLFVLRTPLELALVDRRRHRRLPRTRLAERVAAAETALLAVLVAVAAITAHDGRWWIPAVVAAPLVAVELAYDIRLRRRRLVPELTGAVAIAAVVAAVVIAGDGDPRLAAGLWLILAARVTTSIPHVRAQIDRLHSRDWQPGIILASDLAAVVVAGVAVVLDGRIIVGAAVLIAVVVVQQVRRRRPVAPVKIIGISQMALGFAVVAASAIGVAAW
ncbi:MAG: hypothetical protein F4126_06730 [Acidimicrobiaceae bacterium]|nr:hypothetical protein [Acidimicrobiaceae bacterium]MYB86991.1 hypothetical protein [Acidimicrobiaceae bacterium]MYH93397.1 hypothetical protein [Acidimicrobiaceae bacterium]